jgi:hypothetical protein
MLLPPLALYLNIGTEEFQNTIVEYSIALKNGKATKPFTRI